MQRIPKPAVAAVLTVGLLGIAPGFAQIATPDAPQRPMMRGGDTQAGMMQGDNMRGGGRD
ncbi:MAG: hypothetical protein WD448_11170 [Woeseia sp.]